MYKILSEFVPLFLKKYKIVIIYNKCAECVHSNCRLCTTDVLLYFITFYHGDLQTVLK